MRRTVIPLELEDLGRDGNISVDDGEELGIEVLRDELGHEGADSGSQLRRLE